MKTEIQQNHHTLTQPSEWKICNSCCQSVTYSTDHVSSIGAGKSCHGGIKMSLIYLLTPGSGALLEKLTGSQLVKKLPAFYET
jgi:hypothetical protein